VPLINRRSRSIPSSVGGSVEAAALALKDPNPSRFTYPVVVAVGAVFCQPVDICNFIIRKPFTGKSSNVSLLLCASGIQLASTAVRSAGDSQLWLETPNCVVREFLNLLRPG
jgi:hypothetical protein